MKTLRLFCTCLLLVAACGDDDGGTDSGIETDSGTDSGRMDSGATDSGVDSGGEDSGVDSGVDAGEDSGGMDSAMMDAGSCPDLMPTDPPELIISQVNLTTGEVEVFNPGGTDITIGDHAWCVRPAYPDLASTGPTTVPGGGYAVYTLPGSVTLNPAGGELALYSSGPFGVAGNLMDFICWGTGKSGASREMLARDNGFWSDACAPAPTSGAIVRRTSTDGTSAASYDTTATYSATVCD